MRADSLLKMQSGVLAAGTAFSWITLVLDYRRFFAAGGRAFELSGCLVANPLATPCFYGALAFLAAFVWSIVVHRSPQAIRAAREAGLVWLLAAGSLFAWGNFAYEAYLYLRPATPASAFSCPPGTTAANPLLAPCFYGALFFLTAFILSRLAMRSLRAT